MDSVGIKERDLAVDAIRKYWKMVEDSKMLMPFLIFGPFVGVLLFYTFISSKYGNVVAFSTLLISVWFLVVSAWMLVWILKKDVGDEDMLEVANPIKEGSEGFFITQYGTIFRLAFIFSA